MNDQKWNSPDRIYIPPIHGDAPGITQESAALFDTIQTVNSNYLKPMTSFNTEKKMERAFKISSIPLRFLLLHYYQYMGFFNEDIFNKTVMEEYYSFLELLQDAMTQVISPK